MYLHLLPPSIDMFMVASKCLASDINLSVLIVPFVITFNLQPFNLCNIS